MPASRCVTAPSQNLVYADTAGHIGYQLMGSVPERNRGNGLTPAPGWDAAYDWKGLVPFAELPYAYDPPAGYIVAANQQVIGRAVPPPHRLELLLRLAQPAAQGHHRRLAASSARTRASELFYDDTVRFAADLAPVLLKVNVADPWIREGQQTLVGWDYSVGQPTPRRPRTSTSSSTTSSSAPSATRCRRTCGPPAATAGTP